MWAARPDAQTGKSLDLSSPNKFRQFHTAFGDIKLRRIAGLTRPTAAVVDRAVVYAFYTAAPDSYQTRPGASMILPGPFFLKKIILIIILIT